MDDDAEIRRKTYQITDIVDHMRQSFLYWVLLHLYEASHDESDECAAAHPSGKSLL